MRYSRILSDQDNFVDEIVRLMTDLVRLGYPADELLYRCWQRVRTTPILFGVARGIAQSVSHTPKPRGLFRIVHDQLAAHVFV